MPFDGSLGDAFGAGRRLRPYSRTEAMDELPFLVYRLKQGALWLYAPEVPDMPRIARLVSHKDRKSWAMLFSDFEKCKAVASKVSISAFPTEPVEDILQRIRAQISVEFE